MDKCQDRRTPLFQHVTFQRAEPQDQKGKPQGILEMSALHKNILSNWLCVAMDVDEVDVNVSHHHRQSSYESFFGYPSDAFDPLVWASRLSGKTFREAKKRRIPSGRQSGRVSRPRANLVMSREAKNRRRRKYHHTILNNSQHPKFSTHIILNMLRIPKLAILYSRCYKNANS